jgi:hypothetical protein
MALGMIMAARSEARKRESDPEILRFVEEQHETMDDSSLSAVCWGVISLHTSCTYCRTSLTPSAVKYKYSIPTQLAPYVVVYRTIALPRQDYATFYVVIMCEDLL